MNVTEKVSPAFEPFMADTGAKEKRNAIVVYRKGPSEVSRVRGSLRELRQRLRAVKAFATQQQPIEAKLFSSFQKASRKHLGSKERVAMRGIGRRALAMATVEVTRKTLPDLAANDDVVAIMPNQRISLIKPREVSYRSLATREINDGLTWGLKKLKIPDMWQHADIPSDRRKGKGINVAVLDTGVHGDHPALKGRISEFVVIDPRGRHIKADPMFDAWSHGTHVCGTIAGGKTSDGVSIGVAPEAKLLAAGVLIGDATLNTLLQGIDWAVTNGADIISMSLGFAYYEPLFVTVFERLLDLDVLSVVAIGNEYHGNTSSPGSAYNALSVGALEKMPRGKFEVASFSSGASFSFPGEVEPEVTKPDVVAPGVQIYSSIPPEETPEGPIEYDYMDGSSMATPHVAGVAALLMAAKPDAPAADVMEAIKETAKHPAGNSGRPDNRWGYGLLRPMEALAAL